MEKIKIKDTASCISIWDNNSKIFKERSRLILKSVKPYSSDLREKIIASHQEGVSIRKLAKQFRVSRGMVWNLIKLKTKTGSVEPKRATGGKPSQLKGKEQELSTMVRQYSDYTMVRILRILG